MIELTNGVIKIKVPKRDVKGYLKLGWQELKTIKPSPKPIVNNEDNSNSDSK